METISRLYLSDGSFHRRLGRTLALWGARWRQRRQLAELDVRALNDMGIDPADAWREGHMPFWREGWQPGGGREGR